MKSTWRFRGAAMVGVATAALTLSSVAIAQAEPARSYDLPAQPLASALRTIATQAGLELAVKGDLVRGRRIIGLHGRYSVDEAFAALLADSGLAADITDGVVTIRGRADPSQTAENDPPGAGATPSGDIVVTGTRIRGAPPSSPVITLSQAEMRLEGRNDLGQAIRALPQNFSGGQNPGISIGNFGSTNGNFNGTSSLNLRGLGPDASLTLLNGHRLAYDGALQSVDISAIPIGAVERVEIVADGASALYGSDAVGGVANIILKRDYDGAELSARFGAATDGGDAQQQYSLVIGRRWSTGGFIAAYSYEHDSPVRARQRSYTSGLFSDADILRFQSAHNALLSGHQALGPSLELALDAVYSFRRTGGNIPYSTTDDFRASGQLDRTRTQSFSIAPSLKAEIGPWTASLIGTWGKDSTRARSDYYDNGSVFFVFGGCNCNELRSVELNGEGPLFELPGGAARLALGGGYRWIRYAVSVNGARVYAASRNSYYGYGELFLPFVGPAQDIRFLQRLSLSAAMRYEDYPSMAHVVTPKLGLVYAPSGDLDLKGSWGRSFKAPTLVQQYLQQFVYVYPAGLIGGQGLPPAATVLYLEGGNTDLKPENAQTWSATLALHPRDLPGLSIEASAFGIRYRNRVVQPIASLSGVLTNPIYQSLIAYDPSREAIDTAIGRATSGLSNPFGVAYDPADVAAIIDNRNLNAASQTIRGFDILARYRHGFADGSALTLTANGSYLHSRQRLSSGQPEAALAGTIFNPPHFRGRAGLVWNDRSLTLGSFVDHVGGVTDQRSPTIRHVGGMTTVDLSAQFHLDRDRSPLGELEFSLSAQNIFNAKPHIIFSSVAYYAPFDSTNYSAIGRFLSLTVTKRL